MPMDLSNIKTKVFISHSAEDNDFIEKLTEDLERRDLIIWVDRKELVSGDSLVDKISNGIIESDYFLVALSQHSVNSKWVQTELNIALMNQLSDKGKIIIPLLLDDCKIPIFLLDRIYSDFRSNYTYGFESLCRVFEQETNTVSDLMETNQISFGLRPSQCIEKLSKLRLADLRRLLCMKMSRVEIKTLWFDMFESDMDDEFPGKNKVESVIGLLIKARAEDQLQSLIDNLCNGRPTLCY